MVGRLVIIAAVVLVYLAFGLPPSGAPPPSAAQHGTPVPGATGAEVAATIAAAMSREPSMVIDPIAAARLFVTPRPGAAGPGVAFDATTVAIMQNDPQVAATMQAVIVEAAFGPEVAATMQAAMQAAVATESAATMQASLSQTPTTTPTPVTQGCDDANITPRTEEQIAALKGEADGVTPGPVGTEQPAFIDMPAGQLVDAATAMAVADTLWGEAACFNAGKPLHALAYSTDGRLRREPEWLSIADRIETINVITVAHVTALTDGRVGTLCVFEMQPGGQAAKYCFFIWNGARWLIDETRPLGVAAEG